MLQIPSILHFDPINLTTKHDKQSSWKVTALCLVDGDIDKYYANFIKKRFNLELNRSLRKAHITVINDKVENKEQYNQAKQLFEGKEIIFNYSPDLIRTNGVHWWLNVQCTDIEAIREVAGLTRIPYFQLHLTLGYANEKNIAHSKYIHEQILRFNL